MSDQQQPPTAIAVIKDAFTRATPRFAEVLPQGFDASRLVRIATASIVRNHRLLSCTPASLLQACMQAAELGLQPGGVLGEAYLVPYKSTAQLIVGYRGFVALGRRSGLILDVEARVVYANDVFVWREGDHPLFEHERNLENPGPIRAVYCRAQVKDVDRRHTELLTYEEVEAVRKRSRSANDGPWVTDWGEMAKKTCIRRMFKLLPMSVEMSRAVELDDRDYVQAPAVAGAKQPTLRERAYADSVEVEASEVVEEKADEPE